MDLALKVLPPKPYVGMRPVDSPPCSRDTHSLTPAGPDMLVNSFLDGANFQYCVIYPRRFREQYASWWEDRAARLPLGPEFTCLVLRICSVSIQYLDAAGQLKLEAELIETAQKLTEAYHDAAEALGRSISPGKGGLMQVQQLMLSLFWFKAEAKFVNSWHALGAAIREAQEQGEYCVGVGVDIQVRADAT